MGRRKYVPGTDTPLGRLRRVANISQKDMAKELDINQQYLSRMENGWHMPSEFLAKRIASLLKVPVDEVVRASKRAFRERAREVAREVGAA